MPVRLIAHFELSRIKMPLAVPVSAVALQLQSDYRAMMTLGCVEQHATHWRNIDTPECKNPILE